MNQDLIAYAFQSAPFLLALAFGLLVPVGVVVAGLLAEKWGDSSKIAVMLGVLIIGNALGVALSGRVIYSQEEMALNPMLATQNLDQGASGWGGRLTSLVILFVSLGEIFRWTTGRRTMSSISKQLWLSFLAFYVASYWVGAAFATSRDIQLAWIYSPIAFTALALLAQTGWNKFTLLKLEWVLIGLLAASLLGAALLPGMTVERGYKSWIPGFSFRLYGFSEHANSLGMIAALAVIFQLSPFVRTKPNWVFLAIAVTALLFTQSKTAWVIAAVGAFLVRSEDIRSKTLNNHAGQLSFFLVLIGCVVAALAATGLMVVSNNGMLDRLLNFEEAVTFTGRTSIWQVSWDEFVNNPLFGYGPAIWDLTYRYEKNIMAAGQAHNQFFQTAGQAGLLGLLSLFWYLYLMGRNCTSDWRRTSGLASVALVSLLIRCFTESPMRLGGLSGMDAFVHMLAFIFAASVTSLPVATHKLAASRRSAMFKKPR